jgi:hypothetical protein
MTRFVVLSAMLLLAIAPQAAHAAGGDNAVIRAQTRSLTSAVRSSVNHSLYPVSAPLRRPTAPALPPLPTPRPQ